MFDVFIYPRGCPGCGVHVKKAGKLQGGTLEVRKCPSCFTVFSEFGTLSEGGAKKAACHNLDDEVAPENAQNADVEMN